MRLAQWRRVLVVVVVAVYAVAIVVHRAELAAAGTLVAELPAVWALALAAGAVLTVLTAGLTCRSVTPGLSLRRAVMTHQAATAANNTVVASGPVSLGIRLAMLHSWGIGARTIGCAVVALNVVAAYRLWTVALLVGVLGLVGAADGVVDRWVFLLATGVAGAVLAGATAFWWLLLRHPALLALLAATARRLVPRVRRVVPRVPDLDVEAVTAGFRDDAHALVRAQGGRIAVAGLAEQAVALLVPVLVVRALGVGPEILSVAEVVVVFGLVRVATALAPVPGGIGVAELGLGALLPAFGVAEPTAVACVLVYRSITFVLPLLVGTGCFVAWRWASRPAAPAVPVPAV